MSGSYSGRWREARKMASSQTVPRPLSTFDPSQARLDTCETKMAVRNARSQSFLTSYRKIEDCEQYNVQASTVFFLLFIFQLLGLLFSDGYDQAFSSFSGK